jgi:hypothetical protein
MQSFGAANRDGSRKCSPSRAGRAGVGAQCDLERGASPLRAGAAHRGDESVSATGNWLMMATHFRPGSLRSLAGTDSALPLSSNFPVCIFCQSWVRGSLEHL